MRHTSNNMARHAKRSAKHVRQAARDIRHSANDQAGSVMRAVKKVRAEVTDALTDGLEELRDTAAGYVEEGRDRVQAMEETFEEGIQIRPMTSVLAALGVGFVFGFFFTRR